MSRRVTPRLLVAVVAGLATLALVETALWLLDIDYSPMRVEDHADERQEHLFDGDSFVYDPALIWRPRSGRGVFNRQGFRGPEVSGDKPAGVLRVAAVGDSNTLGWEGATGTHWPGDLEELLRAGDDRHRVINAGVWGYSSHQGVARLRQVLELAPDLVIISFGSNDAHPVAVPDRVYTGVATRPPTWRRLMGGLRLGRLALAALAPSAGGDASTPRVPLTEYRANLRRMIAMCRAAGAAPLLLTRPYLDSVPEPPRWKALAPLYNAATVEVGSAEAVPVVDFYSLFKARKELFADESHFTSEGHLAAARILHQRLLPRLAGVAAD